jgi:putative acetyltransferase
MITIRPETTEDYAAIHEVNLLAFGQEIEPCLVEALRESPDFIPELSLVTIEAGQVVGHILFSPMVIETKEGAVPALTLAPLAVRPEFQNQGIGSELVRDGLERCRNLCHKIVVVVGHPAYYPRFGFYPARAQGLEAPFPVPDEAFLVLELAPGALDGVAGMVRFPPPFSEVPPNPPDPSLRSG